MLSGELPFQGDHEQLVLYSILNKYHKPLAELNPSIPEAMERIVDKCLEKEPSERYQNVNELLQDLRWLKRETESGIVPRTKPTWKRKRDQKLKRFALPVLAMLATVVFITGYFLLDWIKPSEPWKKSIAVLPIKDSSPLKDNESLCVSMTTQINFKLTKLGPELRVISDDLMQTYRNSGKDSIQIGKELKVDNVLVASLAREGEMIQINVELIDVNSNRNVLPISEKFEMDKIFDIEDEISKRVVSLLGFHLSESGVIAAKMREPENVEAYNWYIQGMDAIDKMETYLDLEAWYTDVRRIFDMAISLDPNYALAYWGLGSAQEAYYVARNNKIDLELMLENFEKAYELNPELAETNLALGWAYFYKEDLAKASECFKRALEFEPESALVNSDVGAFLASIGLFPPAIDYYAKAIGVEPSYIRAYGLSAYCHWYIGEYDKAIERVAKAIETEKNSSSLYFEHARNLIMLKKYEEAQQEMKKAMSIQPDLTELDYLQAMLFAARGEKEKALQLIQRVDRPYQYCITCAYALLGMNDEAILSIQQGIDVGFEEVQHYLYSFLLLEKNACFESLRDDPRFKKILKERKTVHDQRIKKVRKLL
jgi:tetratricopeptide (TPR) repeat protein